MNSKTGLSRW